ncbi:succinylglutamate desuccinylase/aspartoacylase family protein [Variovorax sp. PCZ-1]|uniref:succinylglutamate desuccinylase/aspartoacylase family protein n=1 Tax=Variovorax sp. PCZ-1 TaxID=2835533 RepID=UPI001BCFADC3|nr:succinylglutamate desuccinylase/aspartoacylase family protein [Variovorax sp. PCZ-1]MBS7808788.1 succinylglutamate desuccinylase/aspartoacylase family protein [Variovorax sp. PCZ-1]
MHTESIELIAPAPGQSCRLQVLRFGVGHSARKAYIQAALHADEVPAMLTALRLKTLLQALEEQGQLLGEIVLVPSANPLGLSQHIHGQHHGRFSLSDGINFNRGFPELAASIAEHVRGRLCKDAQANQQIIRAALKTAADILPALTPTQDLKRRLLQLAIDADIVIDLHCDSDAVVHLYGLTPQAPALSQLGAQLGAQAILLATESGDSPFDEACSRPWLDLQRMIPDAEIPLACMSTTVELRGEADVSHELAHQDALALIGFLQMQGFIAGTAPEKAALCEPTPLSGSEPITAPSAGVIVFHRQSGEKVQAGDAIADIVNPASGDITTLRCASAGVLYARCSTRWAHAGKRLAKIAGTSLARTGKLLSP